MHSTLANGFAFTAQSVPVIKRCSHSLTPNGLVLWPGYVGTVSAMQSKHPQKTGVPQDIQKGVSLLVRDGEGNREHISLL
jgi:hypothetical protein